MTALFTEHLDAIIAAFTPTAAIIVAALKLRGAQRALHIDLNSRLTELIAATRRSAHAEGLAEGRAENRAP